MQFVLCDTPQLVLEAQRLRYEVFCVEKGWIDPAECPEGVEADPSDTSAVHFLALDDQGSAVGTVRCLLGETTPLPAEKFLDLAALGLQRGRVLEVSRLATLRTSRGQDLRVFLGLTRRMWDWARENGYVCWLAISDSALHNMMVRMGIPAIAEAPEVDYLGSLCVPAAFDMVGTGEALYRKP